MNKAIIDNDVLGNRKLAQEAKFAEFAKAQNNAEYAAVVKNIDDLVAKTTPPQLSIYLFERDFLRRLSNLVMSCYLKTREALLKRTTL